MSTKITDEDFLSSYQINRLKEKKSNPFDTAVLKKRCMILSLAHSSNSLGNSTSCHIFEDQLLDYVKLVDDRQGINNFANATLELMSNAKNVSKGWKSGLPDDFSGLTDLWDPLEGECSNRTSDGQCGNSLPPSSFLKLVTRPKASKAAFSRSAVQTTLDRFNKPTLTEDKSTDKGAEWKKYLFSSYSDFQGNDVKQKKTTSLFRNNPYENKTNGNNKMQLEAKGNTNFKDSIESEKYGRRTGSWKGQKKSSLYSEYSEEGADEPVERSGIYHQPPGGKGYYRKSKPLFASIYPSNSTNDDDQATNKQPQFGAHFKTAGQELKLSNQKKFGSSGGGRGGGSGNESWNRGRYESHGYRGNEGCSGFQPQAVIKKSLGGKRSVSSKFVPPVRNNSQEDDYRDKEEMPCDPESELDERLKNIEPRMIELIKNEIMDTGSKIDWDDIAGLQFAKTTIQEIVVWPMLRPDIFTGLRRPPKGILLFGPPGTGKTLIGKCIASQSNSTFFSISASSLTSKWIGDGEKMVRALFAVARCHQPAVVFIDEIDSLLSQRSDTEHESSRRIKTEFLVQLDGAGTGEEDRILVIGATNRPQELDEAARRRLVKRLYIPLPDKQARKQLVSNLMKQERNDLTDEHIEEISCLTDGYSGADMKNLCQEACLGPIRSLSSKDMFKISAEQVRAVNVEDFKSALKRVKSSVSSQDLEIYLKWDEQYGSGAF